MKKHVVVNVQQQSKNRRKIVKQFFKHIKGGRPKEGLSLFSQSCKQHNPYVRGGIDELFDSMLAAMKSEDLQYPEPQFTIETMLSDGNMVAAYTELLASKSNPSQGGLRQVHLFRFGRGDKIVEYWDISQMVLPSMPAPANAF